MKRKIKFIGITVATCILAGSLNSCDKGEVPAITTADITQISGTSATSGGSITSEGSGTITSRGVCWGTTTKPTIEGDKTTDGAGAGDFSSSITGLTGLTTYYIRAYATNDAGTGYGMTLSFKTTGVIDYDGNFYETVKIGTQEWMAENLKVTKLNDGTDIPNVTDDFEWSALTTGALCWYDNNESANKNTYGALYNWYAVSSGNLCPQDWHVASDLEWSTLENYLANNNYNYDGSSGSNNYAIALASINGWTTSQETGAVGNTDFPEKRNSTGFNALPGGVRDANQHIFGSIGNYGMWWTSTENNSSEAWDRGLASGYSSVGRATVLKVHGFSVRCLKD
jgi:uncharacterized protein (TIGR02145 family)